MRLVPTLLALAALPALGEIELKQEGERLQVLIDGELFTEYRADQKVPCLYPVVSPSGAGLTRNYPLTKATPGEEEDHPHHVSLWFTHGLVNGVDFWAQHLERKGAIVHEGFGPRSSSSVSDQGGVRKDTASFAVNLAWMEGQTEHLSETRLYTITAQGKSRTIDMESHLMAASGDVVFGDTKEGSAALRLAPTLRLKGKVAKGSILNSNGEKDNDCWGKRAAWVAYSGPDGKGEPAVVAMFDHPENLRHPTWWHARDYGLLAANPFGQHDFEANKNAHLGDHKLEEGQTIVFRYRHFFHHGDPASAKLGEVWKDYSAAP